MRIVVPRVGIRRHRLNPVLPPPDRLLASRERWKLRVKFGIPSSTTSTTVAPYNFCFPPKETITLRGAGLTGVPLGEFTLTGRIDLARGAKTLVVISLAIAANFITFEFSSNPVSYGLTLTIITFLKASIKSNRWQKDTHDAPIADKEVLEKFCDL